MGRGDQLRVESALVQLSGPNIVAVTPLSRTDFEAQHSQYAFPVQDLGQQLLGPSFVNGHTHLAMSALRGLELKALAGNVMEDLYYLVESHMQAADVRAFVRMGAYESLLSGVSACWDHYYHAEAIALALQDVGLCGAVAPTLQDVAGPGKDTWQEALDTTLALHENTALRQAGIVPVLGPHATDTVSPQLWQRVAALAEQHGLSIHCHVSQSLEEYTRIQEQHHTTPVGYLAQQGILELSVPLVMVHSLLLSEADLSQLSPERHILGYCPFSQLQFGFPAPAEQWWQRGFRVQVGNDAGACNDTMNVQQELRALAVGNGFGVTLGSTYGHYVQQPGLEQARAVYAERSQYLAARPRTGQVLDSVWSVPGESCPELRLGEIAVGKRANLNLWNPNHPALWPASDPLRALVMGNAAAALNNVMINGQWRGQAEHSFQDAVLNSAAYHGAQAEASERLAHLLRRCGL